MRDLTVAGYWGSVFFSATDQARFFRRLPSMLPRRSRAYARRLLSSIIAAQRWGFSRVAVAHGLAHVLQGRLAPDRQRLARARGGALRARQRRFSLAVLTDGDPSHAYATATLRGVARRLFARGPDGRAGIHPPPGRTGRPPALRPGLEVDLVYRTTRQSHRAAAARLLPQPGADARARAHDPSRVQRRLRRRGPGLLIQDAYRPARASRALVRWARSTGRGDLVGTYIAQRSRHNTGSAVDLTLVRAADGKRLEMGSGYDELGPRAHTLATPAAGRCATGSCSSGPWNASASPATGASGGTSSTG